MKNSKVFVILSLKTKTVINESSSVYDIVTKACSWFVQPSNYENVQKQPLLMSSIFNDIIIFKQDLRNFPNESYLV